MLIQKYDGKSPNPLKFSQKKVFIRVSHHPISLKMSKLKMKQPLKKFLERFGFKFDPPALLQ